MSIAPDSPLVADVIPAANHEPRPAGYGPDLLLLHYTGLATFERSLDVLTRADSRVSCHYLIDEAGRIVQMVPEARRAWHAGTSAWRGETDINSCSIGIEIQNAGHDAGCPPYPDEQIEAVIRLGLDITRRHGIPPQRVLGHSDVAPLRKRDPGEWFPWPELAAAGVGLWIEPEPVDAADPGRGPGLGGPQVLALQVRLAQFGYDIRPTGEIDPKTAFVVAAFQRHFRPARVDGRIDRSTETTLERLIAVCDPQSG